MNSKVLGSILIFGGIAIGAIVYVGNETVNTKSDAEILMEAQLRMQEEERQAAEERAAMTFQVPESCVGVPATSFSTSCDNEVYEGQPVISWARNLSEQAAECVGDAITAKRTLSYAQNLGKTYDPTENRGNEWMIIDACAISSDLMLFVDGIDMNDPDLDAKTSLEAYANYLAEK